MRHMNWWSSRGWGGNEIEGRIKQTAEGGASWELMTVAGHEVKSRGSTSIST